jgi:hypothetical protein
MGIEKTQPEVYIIESLRPDDPKEGEIIQNILKMGGRSPLYRYVQTWDEFISAINDFNESNYRYLHISSHGNQNNLSFEFGNFKFEEFGQYVNPYLRGRRVFISACEAVNEVDKKLAKTLINKGECVSVIGFEKEVRFDVASLFWANFYFLAYEDQDHINDRIKMTRNIILKNLGTLSRLFNMIVNYYSASQKSGIKLTQFKEGKQLRIVI